MGCRRGMRRSVRQRCGVVFLQAEDGIRAGTVTGVQTCALPILEARAAAIAADEACELVWLLEHPPLYTAGVSAKPGEDRKSVVEGKSLELGGGRIIKQTSLTTS